MSEYSFRVIQLENGHRKYLLLYISHLSRHQYFLLIPHTYTLLPSTTTAFRQLISRQRSVPVQSAVALCHHRLSLLPGNHFQQGQIAGGILQQPREVKAGISGRKSDKMAQKDARGVERGLKKITVTDEQKFAAKPAVSSVPKEDDIVESIEPGAGKVKESDKELYKKMMKVHKDFDFEKLVSDFDEEEDEEEEEDNDEEEDEDEEV